MFYVQYLLAEVRRRRGRTALTALGLAVGVGLVVIVGALSKGLDDAQEQVLEPLTGVGTDLAVSRPLLVSGDDPAGRGTGDPFSQLSDEEQRLLEEENENHDAAFNYSDLGEPGERFSEVSLLSSQLSFPSSEVARIRGLDGAEDAAAGLSLRAVRADSVDAVAEVVDQIEGQLPGAEVVTAADLADRVGGSLADAENLSSKLGTALAMVALVAAFLIASLLTLSSVQKRTRELGTLKALGWRQRLVVRQVTGESLVQGALGGLLGAAIGIAAAAIIDAIGPTLEASVEEQSSGGFDPFAQAFGQGNVVAGRTDVVLGAPVDPGLLMLAVGLAIVGGLLAGAAGALRAARLRPAEALRSAE